MKILNTREIKQIHRLLEEEFGYRGTLDYGLMINNKNKIFLINKELSKVDLSKMRVNSLGLYFGEFFKNQVRLSIEGSQLIGKGCTKNVIGLDEEEAKQWLKGYDLEKKEENAYVILSHKGDFLGCGRATGEKILNFVPKNRRLP